MSDSVFEATPLTSSREGFDSIHLYWKNLTARTDQGKVLVNDLSGHVESGQLTAVLGPSGSGKTTLFQCLAKRKVKNVSGDFWVSSPSSQMKDVRIIYNPQHDSLFGVLTVRESLCYAYELQKYCGRNIDLLEDGTSKVETDSDEEKQRTRKESKVNEIIEQLGLGQCADVHTARCSGGQKKRLSIGLELIFSPNVLLLDEPTTGLDSVSSLAMVQLLQSLVRHHPIIICASIHQPSARLFSYFDQLYVISSQGTCIYSGPNSRLLEHLASYDLHCPIFHNLADFLLEVAAGIHGDEIVKKLTDVESRKVDIDQNEHRVHINVDRELSKKMAVDQLRSSWWLFRRSTTISTREPFNYGLRALGLFMLMSVRLILRNRQETLIDNECFNSTQFARKILEMGSSSDNFKITAFLSRDIILLITSIMFSVIISLIPSLMLFPLELSVFIKEHSNRWYTRWSYYVSKSASDVPPTLAFPLVYAIFTYFLVEQPPGLWRFVVYIQLICATAMLSHSFSMIISIFFIDNTIAALITGAMLFVPFFIFSGFIIPLNKLPPYVRPFTYFSIYKLAIEAVLIIYFGFGRCGTAPTALQVSDFAEYLGPGLLNMTECVAEHTSLPSLDFVVSSFNRDIARINQSVILDRFGLDDRDLFINLSIMIVYIVVLRVAAYLVLKWKSIAK